MFVRDLAQALSKAKIRYCIVGGVAVNLHGVVRRTYNLDLVVPPEEATLSALRQLLESFGLACADSTPLEALADPSRRRRWLVEQNRYAMSFAHPEDPLVAVAVVVSPPLDAAHLVRRAKTVDLDGVAVRVAAIADLMLMKRVSGRLLDAGDVARLEGIRRARRRH